MEILESFLKDASCSNDAKNQAVILLAILSQFLENTSSKKLAAILETLFELAAKVQSEEVRKSVCKAIPQISFFMGDKAKSYLMQHLTVLQETKDESVVKGHAYIVAGLFKAKGMKFL